MWPKGEDAGCGGRVKVGGREPRNRVEEGEEEVGGGRIQDGQLRTLRHLTLVSSWEKKEKNTHKKAR